MQESAARVIITVLFVTSLLSLSAFASINRFALHQATGKLQLLALRFSLGSAIASQVLTCAGYWVIGLEGLSLAYYENGTTFNNAPKTYILQVIGMILNWIAQYVFLGLVFSTFSQLRQVSQAWIYSLVCFKASLAVLGVLWIVSIVGFLVFWNDAALFGSFCAIEIVAMIVVYLIIGITTIVAVSKHQRILVKNYPTEAKFVQKKKRVQIASGFLAGVNFLLLAAYGGVEALNADVEQLVLGALMGAFAGSVLMPLLFIISMYFINELDEILRGEVEVAAEESNTTAFSIA